MIKRNRTGACPKYVPTPLHELRVHQMCVPDLYAFIKLYGRDTHVLELASLLKLRRKYLVRLYRDVLLDPQSPTISTFFGRSDFEKKVDFNRIHNDNLKYYPKHNNNVRGNNNNNNNNVRGNNNTNVRGNNNNNRQQTVHENPLYGNNNENARRLRPQGTTTGNAMRRNNNTNRQPTTVHENPLYAAAVRKARRLRPQGTTIVGNAMRINNNESEPGQKRKPTEVLRRSSRKKTPPNRFEP